MSFCLSHVTSINLCLETNSSYRGIHRENNEIHIHSCLSKIILSQIDMTQNSYFLGFLNSAILHISYNTPMRSDSVLHNQILIFCHKTLAIRKKLEIKTLSSLMSV